MSGALVPLLEFIVKMNYFLRFVSLYTTENVVMHFAVRIESLGRSWGRKRENNGKKHVFMLFERPLGAEGALSDERLLHSVFTRATMTSSLRFRGTGINFNSTHIIIATREDDCKREDIRRIALHLIRKLRGSIDRLPQQRGAIISVWLAGINGSGRFLRFVARGEKPEDIYTTLQSHLGMGWMLYAQATSAYNKRSGMYTVEITRYPERSVLRRSFDTPAAALDFFSG